MILPINTFNNLGLRNGFKNIHKDNISINFGFKLKSLPYDTITFKSEVQQPEAPDNVVQHIEYVIKLAGESDKKAKELAEEITPRIGIIKSNAENVFKKVTETPSRELKNLKVNEVLDENTGEASVTYTEFTVDTDDRHLSVRENVYDPLTKERIITDITEKDKDNNDLSLIVFRKNSLLEYVTYNEDKKKRERFGYYIGNTPYIKYFKGIWSNISHLGGQSFWHVDKMLGFSPDNKLIEFKEGLREEQFDIYESYPRVNSYNKGGIFYNEEGYPNCYICNSETSMDCSLKDFVNATTYKNINLKTTNQGRLDYKDGKPYRFINRYTTISEPDGTIIKKEAGEVYELQDGKWIQVDASGFLSEL